jgi:hypothetical protein
MVFFFQFATAIIDVRAKGEAIARVAEGAGKGARQSSLSIKRPTAPFVEFGFADRG